jgi:hypothetical protein
VIHALLLAVVATRVTTYVPIVPPGPAVSGSCWTRSIAAPSRTDAYRCMVGNVIYDPCFAPKRRGDVVCDVNPAMGVRGFALRLTKPLPVEATFTGGGIAPWLVELEDGDVCIPQTGTHEAFGSESIGYECSQPRSLSDSGAATGLLDGGITPGTVWHARKVVYLVSRSGAVTGTVTVVPLSAVWR